MLASLTAILYSLLPPKKLEEVLRRKSESFSEMLFRLIDDKKLDDVTVYKRANIDRKLFSSIRCKPGYKPRKETAVALAIALELDLKTTEDLMSRAGLALSPSNKADLIVAYFISRKNFDIMEINAALFEYGQPLLGSV